MQRHTWRERTDEGLRFFRASYHGGSWTLDSQGKGEDEWTAHDPISLEEWRTLRDVLWRKYQRRRCPWELVDKINRKLEGEAEREREEGREREP